jgi:hypothetical protein
LLLARSGGNLMSTVKLQQAANSFGKQRRWRSGEATLLQQPPKQM